MAVAAGFRVGEMKVRHHPRVQGRSKYNLGNLWWRPFVEMMRLRPQTRLMIISALGDAETAIEAVERGANEYVTKPFTADELNQALGHLIEHGA